MTQILWLAEGEPDFPDTSFALDEPKGLLAAGGKLDNTWLRSAYSKGIFPWFNDGDPILWWSPTPRMVLYPDNFRINKTLNRQLKNTSVTHISFNTCFEQVIYNCANRKNNEETWITSDMESAYIQAHNAGLAHSIEVWRDSDLVGGLYGIAMGNIFFGESMFSKVQSASRFGLLALIRSQPNLSMIDCQLASPHLASIGAITITREEFERQLQQQISEPGQHNFDWSKVVNIIDLLQL